MGRTPNYEIVASTPEAITIRDVGPWDTHLTITNGAEAVVAELSRLGILKDGQRLFYYDSDFFGNLDELDELCHKNGKFTGFAPGGRP